MDKIEIAILRGFIFIEAYGRFENTEEFWWWVRRLSVKRYTESKVTDLMNLAQSLIVQSYPINWTVMLNKLSLEDIKKYIEVFSMNKVENAIIRGDVFIAVYNRFENTEEFWEWVSRLPGKQYTKSKITNLMNLAQSFTVKSYPRNFNWTALIELAKPKYDEMRDKILVHFDGAYHVNKKNVILFADKIEHAE